MVVNKNTSWQKVAPWYHKLVSDEGHYFHQHLIIPNSLRLLSLKPQDSLLDIGCGQGVLARQISKEVEYLGIDISSELIRLARERDRNSNHKYQVIDATKDMGIVKKSDFTHAALILSLQNMEFPDAVINNLEKHLKVNGKLLIVLNHPCFRIPRQTSWGIDEVNKLQYRRVNRYLSPLKIPINMHPGKKDSPLTWSFHFPLSEYSKFLFNHHFATELIEEWVSDKESEGRTSRMENRGRTEIPLFMAILARKNNL